MRDALISDAERVAGGGAARVPKGPADLIDGVAPAVVVEPANAEAVAATLAWASGARLSVVLRGSGTKDAWGRTPKPVDILLSLSRLNRVIAHEADDLTATVEAGVRLSDMNRVLRHRGQWLPLDPPHGADATIGGLLATDDAGPLRHRYGTPRDMVIGMTVAMPDGVLASSGGRVVKNVAGYDVARLMTGSHGSLAAIVKATFKLAPIAPLSRTVVATLPHQDVVSHIVQQLRDRQCEADAIDVRVGYTASGRTISLLARYASLPRAVDDAVNSTMACVKEAGASATVVEGDDEARLWAEQDEAPWTDAETVLRLSWRPAEFAQVFKVIGEAARATPAQWTGRAAVGAGVIGLGGDTSTHVPIIERLRATSLIQHVVIVRSSAALRASVDVWNPTPTQRSLWGVLKQACDPTGTLNAGRGPL